MTITNGNELRAAIPCKRTSVEVAVACAERVLARYEAKYPGDNHPRAAIEAAREWMQNPCEETRAAAYAAADAADAARAAADAAAYAYAAADAAAYAAAAAAYAAAYAAYAAAYAADAAAAAAERRWQADYIRSVVRNPFET